VGVTTCPAVLECVAKIHMQEENPAVDSVEDCSKEKNFKSMSNSASTPVG